ncbi:hypothetical protein ABQG65_06930 [Yersinia alsatica]|uniref:hypothetical protein n=1 Tax=Yersinia alsatica TaxID=2890317 RepID=UPI0032ED4BFC
MKIKYYTTSDDAIPLQKWLSGRPGIGEYRVNWGAGLRVYLMKDGDEIIILLSAGFKDTQDSDLDKAQSYRADYLKRRG